MIYADLNTR